MFHSPGWDVSFTVVYDDIGEVLVSCVYVSQVIYVEVCECCVKAVGEVVANRCGESRVFTRQDAVARVRCPSTRIFDSTSCFLSSTFYRSEKYMKKKIIVGSSRIYNWVIQNL